MLTLIAPSGVDPHRRGIVRDPRENSGDRWFFKVFHVSPQSERNGEPTAVFPGRLLDPLSEDLLRKVYWNSSNLKKVPPIQSVRSL